MDVTTGVTLWQLAVQGGPVMVPIVILSVFVVSHGFYCLFSTRRNVITPESFVSNVINDVKAGKFKSIVNTCKYSAPLLGSVLLPGLTKAYNYVNSKNSKRADKNEASFNIIAYPNIRESIEAEGSRLASRLRQRIVWFSHIGAIAPMFGLLGTVFGMIRAFSSIAYKVEIGKPLLLASAISEAMVTTAGGLLVGIFSMILYFCFHSKTNKVIHEMEACSEDIVDAINMHIGAVAINTQTTLQQDIVIKKEGE